MRTPLLVSAAAAIAFAAAPAFANPDWEVELTGPVSGPLAIGVVEMTGDMRETAQDVGPDEIPDLLAELEDSVARSLDKAGVLASGGAATTINLYLANAEPNRPTQWQLSGRGDFGGDHKSPLSTSSLSLQSLALGEFEVVAEFVSADGQSLGVIEYEYEPFDLQDTIGFGTWTTVNMGIDRFARGLPKRIGVTPQS